MPADRGTFLQALQFLPVSVLLLVTRLLPMWFIRRLATVFADGAFGVLSRRRRIALDNLRQAMGDSVSPDEIERIARASFRSFALTSMPEVVKLRPHLVGPDARAWLDRRAPEAKEVFMRAKVLHETTHGCVFVTPHLGNWELLAYIAAVVEIPLAVVVRPLDNRYLEGLLLRARRETGQIFLAKRFAMMQLQQQLARGRSVAILADQSTVRGVPVEFFGRRALTTPVPALLAIRQQRPIVVVACVRTAPLRFVGVLGEPIWPRDTTNERPEIERLTQAMSHSMEAVVRDHPEQYLWMHDRWKTYG
jgi:Kdo2-lipid IVA lauroyltransferase/acyltransferase